MVRWLPGGPASATGRSSCVCKRFRGQSSTDLQEARTMGRRRPCGLAWDLGLSRRPQPAARGGRMGAAGQRGSAARGQDSGGLAPARRHVARAGRARRRNKKKKKRKAHSRDGRKKWGGRGRRRWFPAITQALFTRLPVGTPVHLSRCPVPRPHPLPLDFLSAPEIPIDWEKKNGL